MSEHHIAGWAAWYALEGKIQRFTSIKTCFEDLPRDGMQSLVTYEEKLRPDGHHVQNPYIAYDYYFRAKGIKDYLYGCEVEVRERNVQKEIEERYPDAVIIRGSFTDRVTLHEVMKEMAEWQP